LDWHEILAIQTRLVFATFPKKIIENGLCMKKIQAAEVHYTSKMAGFWTSNCSQTFKTTWIDMKILLDWYENSTTISRLQGEQNPTNFIENK